jgi:4'-phosphopantetheinyl transferase
MPSMGSSPHGKISASSPREEGEAAQVLSPSVWIVPLDRFEPQALAHLCTVEDAARRDRLRFPYLRRRAEVRTAALRHVLGKRLGVPPRAIAFARDRFGKPHLVTQHTAPPLHFNSTHSLERAAIVLSPIAIGIDLEHADSARPWDEFSDMVCTSVERALIDSLPQPLRARSFYRLWVAKEALVKADGRGLSLPVNEIEAGELAARSMTAKIWMAAIGAHLHVRLFELEDAYVGAIAAAAALGEPKLIMWSPG